MKRTTKLIAGMMLSSIPLFALPCKTASIVDGQTLSGASLLAVGNIAANACSAGLTYVNQTVQVFTFTTAANSKTGVKAGKTNGRVIEEVYQEANGNLDFFYQITNCGTAGSSNCAAPSTGAGASSPPSGGNITSFQLTDYAGVLTSIGYLNNNPFVPDTLPFFTPTAGKDAPSSINRNVATLTDPTSPPGTLDLDTFTILFGTGGAGLVPGANSAIIMIKTNAKNYDPEAIVDVKAKTNSASANPTLSFEPSNFFEPNITPEPAFYGMMGLGLTGLIFALHRRRSAPQA